MSAGSFAAHPVCRSADQRAASSPFASFRADLPPPPDSRFGKGDRPGVEAGCTNPAALGGGKAVARPYLAAAGTMIGGGQPTPPWTSDGKPVTTTFVRAARIDLHRMRSQERVQLRSR